MAETTTKMHASTTMREVMTPSPYSVKASYSIMAAQELMAEKHIRHVPVMRAEQVIGILSERDLRFVDYIAKRSLAELKVEDICVTEPYSVSPDALLADVVHEMKERHVGSALVLEEGKLVGIFTVTDSLELLGRALKELSS